jgi:Ca2+-binding EF-hand superfamily protein
MTVLQLKRLFERFDTDNSGAIDLSELRAMFETAGLLVSG